MYPNRTSFRRVLDRFEYSKACFSCTTKKDVEQMEDVGNAGGS